MALKTVGPQGVTVVSPPSYKTQYKSALLEVGDGSTGFAAFALPKDVFITDMLIICTGANTTQTVNVGFTNGGVELLSAFSPNSCGRVNAGTSTGTSVGTKLTEDKLVYVKASATLTTPVFLSVGYHICPQGQPY